MSEVEFSLPVSKNQFTVENVQALMIIRGHTEWIALLCTTLKSWLMEVIQYFQLLQRESGEEWNLCC